MRAAYLDPSTVRLVLDKGERMATAEGPGTFDIAPMPGLLIYDALVAAGVPIAPPPRRALGGDLRAALKATGQSGAWQTALTGQSQDTRDWWANRYDRDVLICADKLVRIAAACMPPVDLDKLFTAAGA